MLRSHIEVTEMVKNYYSLHFLFLCKLFYFVEQPIYQFVSDSLKQNYFLWYCISVRHPRISTKIHGQSKRNVSGSFIVLLSYQKVSCSVISIAF